VVCTYVTWRRTKASRGKMKQKTNVIVKTICINFLLWVQECFDQAINVWNKVVKFFLGTTYQSGKIYIHQNLPNRLKIQRIALKIPNWRQINQNFPFEGTKCTKILFFGMQIYQSGNPDLALSSLSCEWLGHERTQTFKSKLDKGKANMNYVALNEWECMYVCTYKIVFQSIYICAETKYLVCVGKKYFSFLGSSKFSFFAREKNIFRNVFWKQGCQMFFSNQKSKFGYILEGLGMENFVIFYDHLVYFMAVCYSLWSFDIYFPFW
jgi:hypothetical protein